MSQERRALDATAISMMVLLTALWGFQQVTIKLIAADVSLVMQAAIRSGLATLLVLAWSWWKGIDLLARDGTLAAGLAAGLLFGLQWGGVLVAFAGLALAFSEGFHSKLDTWIGDLCGLAAAALWAATTVLIRASGLARISATKTLSYQLGVSTGATSRRGSRS